MSLVNPFEDAEFLQQVKTVEEKIPVVSDEYKITYEGHDFWAWKREDNYYLWTVDPEDAKTIRFHEYPRFAQRMGELGTIHLYEFTSWYNDPMLVEYWSDSYSHTKLAKSDGWHTSDHWQGKSNSYKGQKEIESHLKFMSEYYYGGWFDFIRGKMEAGE